MGIKNFNTWFGKTFPQAYVPVKRHCDHLYLDMASFLHEELRKGRYPNTMNFVVICLNLKPRIFSYNINA